MRGLDVRASIGSGQVFLWERRGRRWQGIDGSRLFELREDGPLPRPAAGFFRAGDDYDAMLSEISADPVVARAVRRHRGLRLLRQDPFQCCITFIVSANSSMARIRDGLARLCSAFGERSRGDGRASHFFPPPARLARASLGQLRACGLGYRAGYVREAARMAPDLDLEGLRGRPYPEARERLLGVPGIGPKVADCIMLFSLEKLDAFPIDTWMGRALRLHYPGAFAGRPGTEKKYMQMRAEALRRFGRYAGLAQQFLFKDARDVAGARWPADA